MTSNSNPPSADIAEQAIISTLFDQPERFFPRLRAAGVTAESFWTHRRIFEAVNRFFEDHGAIEPTAFIQDLTTRGEFEALGGGAMMETLQFMTYGSFGWSKWVDQLQEAYALRIAHFLHIASPEYETSEDATAAITAALETIMRAKSGPIRLSTAKESAEAFLEMFIAQGKAGAMPGLSTGIPALDEKSGGMRPAEVWVICAKTSRGKSVLMLQLACEVMSVKKKALIFSLEMSKAEVVGRIVAFTGFLDYGNITKPRAGNDRDRERISAQVRTVATLPFWVDDSPGQTMDYILTAARDMRDTEGEIAVIIIDYLQYVTPDPTRRDTREQEVARISRAMKQLAKEMNCPVITGAQLNDEGQARESRAICMDADALLFIADDGVKVGKLRNGPRDEILPIFLDGRLQRFVERR